MSEPARFRVALTFDAEHPDRPRCRSGVQEEMVNILDDLEVRATFFLQGRWVTAYPETARAIAARGHLVGSHSFFHVRMPLLSNEGLRTDIAEAEAAIVGVTGVDPKPWFRCPWGDGADDVRVLDAIAASGYRHCGWHVWAQDWEEDRTPRMIEEAVLPATIARGDGTIVLLHTWPEPTVEALPAIVAGLREAGATFVAVDALDGSAAIAGVPSGTVR